MGIPVGFCEIWFRYTMTGDNEPMYTALGFAMDDVPTQAAVDAGFADWQNIWKPEHCNDVALEGGHVLVGNDGGAIRWDSSIAGVAGTAAGTSVPNNCAYLLKKTTASGGRRNRGRMYIPGVPESLVNGAGVLTAATITAINTNATAWMPGGSTVTAFGFITGPSLFHSSGSQTPTVITDLSCQNKIGTQRRRMRK